jgi:pimeloyl-ACP methyl ester carboxylesterase
MKPWPALAPFGRQLRLKGDEETLFYYDTQPQDTPKPPIILIHGLGDEADSWRHLFPLLSEEFRVLALDLPGFGRSAAPGRINLKRHIAVVLALLAETGPAVLAGSSMGAVVAEGTAMANPGMVRGLVLLDGCFPMDTGLGSPLLLMALPFLGKHWYRAFRADHEGAWRSLFGYYADIQGLPEAEKQFLRERVIARVESSTQERAYFATLRSLIWARAVLAGRFVRFMAAFPGKIRILWGAEDKVLPPEAARTIRERRPDAVFSLIEGAGHLPQQERPAPTAAAIGEFVAEAFHS